MSQFKINKANKQYPLDALATITVASTTGFVAGQACFQGTDLATSTASAKISAVIDSTKLRVKGVKGTFADATAVKSATVPSGSNQAASGFSYGISRTRNVAGTPTAVTFGAMTADDRGIIKTVNTNGVTEVAIACRQAISKMQDTDTTVAPTLTYTIPADDTYGDGEVMRFTIASNEALSVTGSPRVAIVTLGSAETVYATYKANLSNSRLFVFEYAVDQASTTAGQIVSVAYNANGAVFTDIGGTTVVPNFNNPSVTGILIA